MSQTIATSLPHTLIRASAGTGKTFQLSNRYLALLLDGAAPERILASTFTKKAAGEILGRILERIAQAATDDRRLKELDRFLNGGGSLSRERCLELLVQLTHNLHQLRIGTLDSFFAQIARGMCLELGLSPRWSIVSELDDERLRDEAIEAVLAGGKRDDLLRIYYLMTRGEAQRSIADLARTTVKEVYGLFQETSREAWFSLPRRSPLPEEEVADLIDELRSQSLSDKRMEKPRNGDAAQAADGDWEKFLDGGLAAKVVDGSCTYYRKEIPAETVAVYERLIEHAQAVLLTRIANQTEGTYELLAKFDVEYQRLKHERRALRFEDVTRRLASALAPDEVARLAFRLDAGIDHLLLDEFQDTSPLQWRVLRPFAQQVMEPGSRKSFFCVGDVKQAIYGWRGGVAEIFDAVESELEGLKVDPLNTSYRSAQPVIDVVNRVFRNVTRHDNLERLDASVHRWSDRFDDHETARKEKAGYVRLETPGDLTPIFEFAARRVAEIVSDAPGHTVGVLVRRNTVVAELIYHLHKLGVHASEEGGVPPTDSAAVLLVLSALRLADHPGDTVAFFHVANSPLGEELGLRDVKDAAQRAAVSQDVRRRVASDGYGRTIYEWARVLAPHCNRRELSRLEQLVSLAYGYEPDATLRTDDFRALVERQRVADPLAADVRVMTVHQAKGLQFDVVVLPELDANLVGQVSNFVEHRPDPTAPPDLVCRYVGGSLRPLLPHAFQPMFDETTDREVTEALCVLYVAMTRAIHALDMIIAPRDKAGSVKTFAGLLRAALLSNGPAPPGSVLYEHGDAQWHEHPNGKPRSATAAASTPSPSTAPQSLRVKLAPPLAHRWRGLNRASPSGLEGGSRVRLKDLLRRGDSIGMQRGTLIHAWFEEILWLEDGVPSDKRLDEIAAEQLENVTSVDVAAAITDFRAMLANDKIARYLRRSAYDAPEQLDFSAAVCELLKSGDYEAKVDNERRFAIREGDGILTGSVDRLVVLSRGGKAIAADILDFKTDAIGDAADALDKKVAFYRPQVEAYRRAVAKMLHLPPDRIASRLLFVGIGVAQMIAPP